MSTYYKKIFSVAVVLSLLLPFYVSNADVTSAVAYLKTKGQNPWITMALVSAGEPVDVSYLKSVSGDSAIALEAPILALTAAGKNPRSYTDEDLVAALKGFYANGQIGDAAVLNDDVFGVLALVSSGESTEDAVVAGARDFIIQNQNEDGGWPFAVGGTSDTNTTAVAIMALLEAGVSKSNALITNALVYLRSAQNDDGGFPYDPQSQWGTDSDASSDAWIISALYRLDENPTTWTKNGQSPIDHLLSLQTDGYFQYQEGTGEDSFSPITTSYAVVALSGKSYPVGHIIIPEAIPLVGFRIEGSREQICSGEARALNPLELVEVAADICGFTFHISELSFGPYLDRIGDDEAGGLVGWLYRVNYILPSVGAVDYNLSEEDEVLWYYGEFEWHPVRIKLDDSNVASDELVGIGVEYYNDTSWLPLEGAMVYVGALTYTTNSGGTVSAVVPDGVYRVFAEKDDFVRSEKKLLVVGEKVEAGIALSAIISDSAPGGAPGDGQDFISFVVNTDALDFGSLEPGQTVTEEITIINDGQVGIYVESIVSGDDLFLEHLTVGDVLWRIFSTTIAKAVSHDIAVALSVPLTYTNFGERSGTLTFWAIQVP